MKFSSTCIFNMLLLVLIFSFSCETKAQKNAVYTFDKLLGKFCDEKTLHNYIGKPNCNFPEGEITVRDKIRFHMRCTKQACSRENPCCNNCGGYPYMSAKNKEMKITWDCSGNNCNFACPRLIEGQTYEFTGKLKKEEYEFLKLVDVKKSKRNVSKKDGLACIMKEDIGPPQCYDEKMKDNKELLPEGTSKNLIENKGIKTLKSLNVVVHESFFYNGSVCRACGCPKWHKKYYKLINIEDLNKALSLGYKKLPLNECQKPQE